MKLLACDTSTKHFSLAVSDGATILKDRSIKLVRPLSSSMIPAVRDILKKADVALDRIDGYAVGLGPGSFTSLRVGLSTIKGLAFAMQKPVVGICSLDVLAQAGDEKVGQICVLNDARRDLVYAGIYRKKNGVLKRTGKYLLAGLDEVLSLVDPRIETLFAGDAVGMYQERIVQKIHHKAVFRKSKQCFPQAKNLIPLALERFRKGKTDDIDKLVPLYLYPEDCQVKH